MSPRGRYLSSTMVLVVLAGVYALWQGQVDRPTPRLPPGVARVSRPAPPARIHPPLARDILDRAAALELSDDQVVRLRALDRRWSAEAGGLEAAIRQAEGEFSTFMDGARAPGGTSVQEIQRRSADLRNLGALLRERRRVHSDSVVGLLVEWQRRRLDDAGEAAGATGRY